MISPYTTFIILLFTPPTLSYPTIPLDAYPTLSYPVAPCPFLSCSTVTRSVKLSLFPSLHSPSPSECFLYHLISFLLSIILFYSFYSTSCSSSSLSSCSSSSLSSSLSSSSVYLFSFRVPVFPFSVLLLFDITGNTQTDLFYVCT